MEVRVRHWMQFGSCCVSGPPPWAQPSAAMGAALRSLERVADTARGLFLPLSLHHGLMALTNLLVGTFAEFVATDRRPLACVGHTLEGPGIGPAECPPLRLVVRPHGYPRLTHQHAERDSHKGHQQIASPVYAG